MNEEMSMESPIVLDLEGSTISRRVYGLTRTKSSTTLLLMKRLTILLKNEKSPKMTPGLSEDNIRGIQKMGLWRDGQGKLKFATERELPERLKVPAESQDSDFYSDMQPFYDREEDEYLLRIENSPRWDWGRDAKGQVWYWQISGTAGHATEAWRFEHNGEYAYGNEPLDFWDDWYDEPGDTAEGTPYGWNLAAFLASNKLGGEIPQWDTCKSLRLYCQEDDPMAKRDLRFYLPKPVDFEVWSDKSWDEIALAISAF